MRAPPRPHRRIPIAVWIGVAVVSAHALFFWVVWNKHFLPKTPPAPAPPPTPNFGMAVSTTTDPATGETVTEQEFSVSTRLATPPASAQPSARP